MSGVTNIFSLLGEDGDEDVKNQPQQAAKKTTQKTQQPQAKTPQTAQQPNKAAPQTQKKAAPLPPSEKSSKEDNSRKADVKKDITKKAKEIPESGEKRVFDKHSGTGRPKNENKRQGSGKGNWGKEVDDSQPPVEAAEKVEQTEQPASQEGAPQTQEGTQSTANTTQESQQEEEKKLSLSEYKKKQKAAKAKTSAKARQAGEGVDTNEWKAYAPLERDGEETVLFSKKAPAKKEEASKDATKKKEEGTPKAEPKIRVDDVLKFETAKPNYFGDGEGRGRGRGGRGGRGGNRGGNRGGRGGSRGGRGGSAPDLGSENFPALTTKA